LLKSFRLRLRGPMFTEVYQFSPSSS
jgi:hypothetical protein